MEDKNKQKAGKFTINNNISQKVVVRLSIFGGAVSFFRSLFSKIGIFFKVLKNKISKIIQDSKILRGMFSRKFGMIVLIALVGIYILSGAVVATGVYKYKWSGQVRHYGERIYPLPAAYVGGSVVWLKSFDTSYAQSKYFVEKNNQQMPPEADFQRDMLNQMIDIKVWDNQARKYKVKVTSDDFNASYSKLIEQAGGEDKAKEMLKEFWGMSLNDLKSLVKDQLPREKLSDKMNNELLSAVKAQHILITSDENLAKDVAAKSKGDAKFDDLIKEYSQDATTKDKNGDLGWFTKGVMDPDFEKAAFAMKPGDISDPIKTQFGFHIIKVNEKRGTIDNSLEGWFNDAKSKTKIFKFVAK